MILADTGDSVQGEPIATMTKGEANIKLMNEIGYDVATIGNHEFDYGMERFLELTEMANFPYISANFTKLDEPVFAPYTIFTFDGIDIAFIGISTPYTITSSTPKYFQDENGKFIYGFMRDDSGEALYQGVQSAVDSAIEAGADYVIALAHLGIEAGCSPWTSSEVITNTTGIDALLDGHSHSVLDGELVKNKDGKEVLHIAAGTKLSHIGGVRISKDGGLTAVLYEFDEDTGAEQDAATAAIVANSMTELEATLSQVVAKTDFELTINDPETGARIVRTAETNLGDLCADALRDQTGAEASIVNGGGVRVSIAAGDITLNNILSVHPFGNTVCLVKVTGQQILDALEWGARHVPEEGGSFLQVSGISYEIHTYIASSCIEDENGMFAKVDGEYRVKNVMIGGEALDAEKVYTLAGTNYILKNNGDGYTMFAGCEILMDEVQIDNQALINYITGTLNGVIGEAYSNPYGDGRIVAVAQAE